MIVFSNVSKVIETRDGPRPLLAPCSMIFPRNGRIGILAHASSGKTSLIRLLLGIEEPSTGKVTRDGLITGPLGHGFDLHADLTVREAIKFAADIRGVSAQRAISLCPWFAGLDHDDNPKIRNVSPITKSTLSFCFDLLCPSDMLVADDRIIPNDTRRSKIAAAMLAARMRSTGLIYITKNSGQLRKYCSEFYAFCRGTLIPTDNLAVAETLVAR